MQPRPMADTSRPARSKFALLHGERPFWLQAGAAECDVLERGSRQAMSDIELYGCCGAELRGCLVAVNVGSNIASPT